MILNFKDFVNEHILNEEEYRKPPKDFFSLEIAKGKIGQAATTAQIVKDSKSLEMWITYFKKTLIAGNKLDKNVDTFPTNIESLIKSVNLAYQAFNSDKTLTTVKFLEKTENKEQFPGQAALEKEDEAPALKFYTLEISKGDEKNQDSKSLKMWNIYFKKTLEIGKENVNPSTIEDLLTSLKKAYKIKEKGKKKFTTIKLINTTDKKEIFPDSLGQSETADASARVSENLRLLNEGLLNEGIEWYERVLNDFIEIMNNNKDFVNISEIQNDGPNVFITFTYKGNLSKLVGTSKGFALEVNRQFGGVVNSTPDLISKLNAKIQ